MRETPDRWMGIPGDGMINILAENFGQVMISCRD
jgi:hypothetical protein